MAPSLLHLPAVDYCCGGSGLGSNFGVGGTFGVGPGAGTIFGLGVGFGVGVASGRGVDAITPCGFVASSFLTSG